MERLILKKLLDWKNSPYRKPLILKGVRQVGKTWILKEFGRCYYENTAYFNFDENEEYRQFFETTKDVERILQNLMLASGQKLSLIHIYSLGKPNPACGGYRRGFRTAFPTVVGRPCGRFL